MTILSTRHHEKKHTKTMGKLKSVNKYKMRVDKSDWQRAGKTNARYVEFQKVESLPNIRKNEKLFKIDSVQPDLDETLSTFS